MTICVCEDIIRVYEGIIGVCEDIIRVCEDMTGVCYGIIDVCQRKIAVREAKLRVVFSSGVS
jgi:hypothetical protein